MAADSKATLKQATTDYWEQTSSVIPVLTKLWFLNGRTPVSYTHLDVYKRQMHYWTGQPF